MSASTAIAAIRSGKSIKLGSHKVFAARAAMPASAINPNLINEIVFFHYLKLPGKSKRFAGRDIIVVSRR